jgi:uncharacterized protein YndB with AHSA1/START domain
MNPAIASPPSDTMEIVRQVSIKAPIEIAFAALLQKLGPENEGQFAEPMPMVLEARPGGRWYRDLGDDNGHLWGHVQAIKRPTLVELWGPLFMSEPTVSNLQYRLEATDEGTLLKFRHAASGVISAEHREGIQTGWDALLERVRTAAEAS